MRDYHEYIEAYCEGQLDAPLKTEMDQAMQSDPSLAQAVQDYPAAKKLSEGLLELDMRTQLEALAQTENTKVKSIGRRKWIAAAAAVLALIAMRQFWPDTSQMSGEEIWQAHYEPYTYSSTRGHTNDDYPLLDQAKRALHDKEYEIVQVILDSLATQSSAPQKAQEESVILTAHLLIANNEFKKALDLLKDQRSEDAIYLRVLLLLKTDQTEVARKLINDYPNKNLFKISKALLNSSD